MQKTMKAIVVVGAMLCASVALGASNPYSNYIRNDYYNLVIVPSNTVAAASLLTATNTLGGRVKLTVVNTNANLTVSIYTDPNLTNSLVGVIVGSGGAATFNAGVAQSNVFVFSSDSVPDINGNGSNNTLAQPFYARTSTNGIGGFVTNKVIVIESYSGADGTSPVIQQ